MDFFTSDWHLNDELVLKVCKRQFKSAARMTEVIMQRANQRAKFKSDNIIHVGDFIQRGLDRGTGDKATQVTTKEVLDTLQANVVLIEGNHDEHNRCNTVGKVLLRKIGKYDCVVQHYPSYLNLPCVPSCFKTGYALINICGHVHDKWAFSYDRDCNVLNVNVGIDIYPYMIKECELVEKIAKFLQEHQFKPARFL